MTAIFRAHFPCFALLGFLSVVAPVSSHAADPPQPAGRPNIIFILVDDMGWTDLGCTGSKFYETPHIDRLASQGMRFTQAYSACTVCSPTRAAVLTGQYPARLHITDWIAGHVRPRAKLQVPDWTMHLPRETMNIARALRPAGYASASIGKWHLGGAEFYPDRQGFDLNIAGTDRGQPPSYFSPYKIATLPDGPAGEFLSDRLTDEALKFIEAHQNRPFLLYLPHFAVHTPLMAKPAVIEKYQKKADPNAPQHNAVYAALVESVDDSVGRIVRKLDELRLAENTIVFFTSDNGGLIGSTVNLGLRAGKGSCYEGGVRVPLIVKWPGVTKAGSVCETPVISVDYLPTMLAMAGTRVSAEQPLDGESLVPLLKQSGALKRDAIYWHYPHYHPGGATPYGAVREGDVKLIEFYEDDRVELYNLKDDLAEKNDLAETMPDRAAALREKLQQWRASVGAQMPGPNPNYNPDAARPKAKDGSKQAAARKTPAVIFDTDMGSDCDDAGALAVLHALADAGEVRILGVVFSSGKNRYGVGTCDAINTYYGRGDLPLGQYQGTDVGDPWDTYTKRIATDTPRFGHEVVDKAPDLVSTYMTILESQPDGSVTIVTVGHPHGLVHLLRDPHGAELVCAKVDRWVAMGMGGWNFEKMGMSAYCQELLDKWTLPFYISPSGEAVKTGHRLLPGTPETNPVREAYRLWGEGTAIKDGRSSWDQVAVLFVARPELYTVEQHGSVERPPAGDVIWNPHVDKANHFLVTPKLPNDKMAEIIEELMARPPKARRGSAQKQ